MGSLLSSFADFYDRNEKHFAYLVIHYRWVFVILFLLPLSFFYDIFWTLRVKYQDLTRHSAPSKHRERVQAVCEQINEWRKQGMKNFMCTARPGWLTVSLRVGKYKSKYFKVNVDMSDILEINIEKGYVRAEPGVSMAQLTKVLTPLNLTLAVVPELDDLTVGGLINGFGVETSSFRHGLFQHCCSAFEIVLPNGKAVTATETEYPELFRAIPWSHGTLGFLVSADIKIVPAGQYVRLEYYPAHVKSEFCRLMDYHSRRTDDGIDFVEGLQYNLNDGVVMVGKMVNSIPSGQEALYNPIGRYYKPWFYTDVEKFLKTGGGIEYIPLRDYYHRHSRSIFWEMQDIIPFGNHWLFRYLLGWQVPPKISLLKLTTTGVLKKLYTQNHVVQDMLVPIRDLEKSIDIFHEEFNVYPLWHCPMRIIGNKPMPKGDKEEKATNGVQSRKARTAAKKDDDSESSVDEIGDGLVNPLPDGDEMFIDVGAYGNPKPLTKEWDVVKSLRRVEEFVRDVHGYQALYADTYMTKEEFLQMFNHSLYYKVRKQYQCDKAFPEIYDKVAMHART